MIKQILVIATFLLFFNLSWSVVDCLKCYQCGEFLATTSVSPCPNLTRVHLKECTLGFCSKYVGLSTVVYKCESNCIEKPHGSFHSYCCSEDRCNDATSSLKLPKTFKHLLSALLLLTTLCFVSL